MNLKLKSAIILAAGYGTRLMPLSNFVPKPLIIINKTPLIFYQIQKLKKMCQQDHKDLFHNEKKPLAHHLVFSFNKFPNVNKELGPEMKSTGESIYFIDDLNDDYFTKVYSERNLYLSK